jgi:glutamate racemase
MRPPSDPRAPIGVFDSGLGGLTVAAAIAAALPHEELLYLGDTARVPYGTRSPATVVRYARNNVAFLRSRRVKLVVVACNTVSAHALGGLLDGATTPTLGVIRPGARAAVAASKGVIAVLGTPSTIDSQAYVHAIHELDPRRTVLGVACPLFVPLVEEGWLAHSVTRQVAEEYLAPLAGAGVDTLILGCTHYPLIRPIIAEVAKRLLGEVTLVDSAAAAAQDVATLLSRAGLSHPPEGQGAHHFFVTDAPERVGEVAGRFWPGAPPTLEHVDITDEGP